MKKDVVLMCKGNIITDQAKAIFNDLDEKELEIIKNLGFYTDFDLEEKISELSDYEALHEVSGSKEEHMAKETEIDKITTELAEHICDNLCRYPHTLGEEELEDKCLDCKTAGFICKILNEYNKLNDFEKTQTAKLMKKLKRLESRDERAACKNVRRIGWMKFADCPKCGKRISNLEGGKFCANCGQRVKMEE